MDNFEFYSPTYFVFGKRAERAAGSYAKKFGATKVLLHYGRGSAERSGLLSSVKQSLSDEGVKHVDLGGVDPNPRAELVYGGIELARMEHVDMVLAVGGGSAIDSAKAIAAGVPYSGDFWDFYSAKAPISKALPVGAVLTIAAAGSEGSPASIISSDEGRLKRGAYSDHIRPKFAILNPELTATLPPFQVAAGGADIMAHLFERYFTNTKDVETTDRLIEGLLLAVIKSLPAAVANPADYAAQSNIMWAGTMAHNNSVGVGRVQDWASHRIEHELSALYGVAHGAGLAVVFPAWMKYVWKHDEARFAQLAIRVWGISPDGKDEAALAMAGIEALEKFWKSLGLPTTFAELGGREEDIPRLAKNVAFVNGTTGNFILLSEKDVRAVYALMK